MKFSLSEKIPICFVFYCDGSIVQYAKLIKILINSYVLALYLPHVLVNEKKHQPIESC